MNGKGSTRKELPGTELELLFRHLDPDRDAAGVKYEEIRFKLIRFFGWNDCDFEDDLADKVFDRVASRLQQEDIRNLRAFIWGVARNIVLESRKKPPALPIDDLPLEWTPLSSHPELEIIDEREKQRRVACLHRCLQTLTPRDRELFLRYEYYVGRARNTARLAEGFGMTVGALQTRAHRLKHRVERCVLKCFYFSLGKDKRGL
jgi:DNA-directed RNA polymerase specialized sigma24 family protein